MRRRIGTSAVGMLVVLACTGRGQVAEAARPAPAAPTGSSHQAIHSYPASPATAGPAQPDPFPPPSTATPPPGYWAPPQRSDEDKARRAAANLFFKRSKQIDADFMGNVSTLKGELERGQYDLIESQLDAILARSLADPGYELLEQVCANFAEDYSKPSSTDTASLDIWVKLRPRSAWAHYSRGLRWSHDAWIARGSGFADSISDQQAATMHQDEGKARAELHTALGLDPRIAIAWVTLMDVDKTDDSLEAVARDYGEAIKHRPASFLIPDKYEEALEPRWYGSSIEMYSFALDEATKTSIDARLWIFQGYASADQGCTACNGNDWRTSLAAYSAALVYGDRPSWLEKAGDAALRLHRYALAHAFYARAKWYSPENLDLVIDSEIMDALCNPKAPPGRLETLEQEGPKYSRVPMRDYPREAGDCDYYASELPWGDEPLPDPGYLPAYNIQLEQMKATAQKRP